MQSVASDTMLAARVGAHFTLREFEDRRRPGSMPVAALPAVGRITALLLDPLRVRFGTTRINSGYRTTATNTQVGGASRSFHMWHNDPWHPAVDLSCATGRPQDWYSWLDKRLGDLGIGGGLGVYRSHVHVDLRPSRTRWSG